MEVPDAVATVVDTEFGGSHIQGVDRLSGGCKDTYRVALGDETVVVAFPREPWYERAFALEPALMRLVRAETSLPVPRVLASDLTGARPYHVTAFIDAPDLEGRFAACSRETQAALLETAGAALAELHREVKFASNGPLRVVDGAVVVEPHASWPTFLAALVEEWLTELEERRFADLRGTFESVLTPESFLSEDLDTEPVCLHFDYAPGNLLARDEEIVGVVDWGFAVAGHAEYDLFQFEKNVLLGQLDDPQVRDALRPHVYAGYREETPLDPGWERRRAFYRVAYKLASMRSFHRWSENDGRDALARRLRAELETDLDHLRTFE